MMPMSLDNEERGFRAWWRDNGAMIGAIAALVGWAVAIVAMGNHRAIGAWLEAWL